MFRNITNSLSQKAASYEGELPRPKTKFWKFWVVMLLFTLAFLRIEYELFSIQIVRGEEYASLAKKQSESNITIKSARGDILDRKGNLMATTVYTVSVAADPFMLEQQDLISTTLSDATGLPKSHFTNKLNNAKKKKRRFVWLSRDIDSDKTALLKAIDDPGLIINTVPKRKLPLGSSVSQIVGFVNVDGNGISGIELAMDSILKGRDGRVILLRDALGNLKPRADLPRIPEIDGMDVQLTLDSRLQRIVELELMKGLEYAAAESATAVALNPATGEVLAMATYPSYDPNTGEGVASARIRSITDTYEPGSTFKLITAAACLQEGIASEDQVFFAHHGLARYKGYTINDIHKVDSATFRDAIRYSSNIVMADLANTFSNADFYSYVRDFGFGLPTEIELPGENSGKVKQPKEFSKATKRFMGHGYGLTVTPLQICNAYATVANGGNLMTPYIVKKIIDANGNTIAENNPEKVRQVISKETAQRLTPLFVAVVDSGTGSRAAVTGLDIAGKTGTSQQIEDGHYSKRNYTASFAGYFPANNPEVAMLVYVDKPRTSIYGGSMAAPIFRNIAARYIGMEPRGSNNVVINSDTLATPPLFGLGVEEAQKTALLYGFSMEDFDEDDYDDEDGELIVFGQRPEQYEMSSNDEKIKFTVVPEGSFSPKKSSDMDSPDLENQLVEHDFKGLPLRRAIAILNSMDVTIKVVGSGTVRKQKWTKAKGEIICELTCRR